MAVKRRGISNLRGRTKKPAKPTARSAGFAICPLEVWATKPKAPRGSTYLRSFNMHRGQRPARARGREGSLAARPHRITTAINSRTELQLRPMSRQRIAQGVQRDLERKAGGAPPGGVRLTCRPGRQSTVARPRQHA